MVTEQQLVNSYFQVNSDNVCREVNHIMYVWNERKKGYYKLGELGNVIWTYCQYPITKEQIVRMLMDEYVVPQEECQKQVEILLMELLEDDLLQLVDLKGRLE